MAKEWSKVLGEFLNSLELYISSFKKKIRTHKIPIQLEIGLEIFIKRIVLIKIWYAIFGALLLCINMMILVLFKNCPVSSQLKPFNKLAISDLL